MYGLWIYPVGYPNSTVDSILTQTQPKLVSSETKFLILLHFFQILAYCDISNSTVLRFFKKNAWGDVGNKMETLPMGNTS